MTEVPVANCRPSGPAKILHFGEKPAARMILDWALYTVPSAIFLRFDCCYHHLAAIDCR